MKNSDIINLRGGLDRLSHVRGLKVAYAIAKNKKILDKVIRDIEGLFKPTKEFEEYEQKAHAISRENAILDEKGNVKVFEEGGMQVFKVDPDKKEAHQKALSELIKENEKVLICRQAQLEDQNAALNKKTMAFQLHKIKLTEVPSDISAEEMEVLLEFIDEKS